MHELSIAAHVVEQAAECCRAAGGRHVVSVTLRIGRLACVHEAALRLGFEALREGTLLESAELRIIDVPVRIWCPACAAEVDLPGIQSLASLAGKLSLKGARWVSDFSAPNANSSAVTFRA